MPASSSAASGVDQGIFSPAIFRASLAAAASSSAARASSSDAPRGTPRRPSTSTRSGPELDHSPPAMRPTLIG